MLVCNTFAGVYNKPFKPCLIIIVQSSLFWQARRHLPASSIISRVLSNITIDKVLIILVMGKFLCSVANERLCPRRPFEAYFLLIQPILKSYCLSSHPKSISMACLAMNDHLNWSENEVPDVKGILWDFFIFTLEQIIVLNKYCT